MIQKVLKQACAAVWCLIVLSGCTAAAEGTASAPTAAASEGDQLLDSADLLGSIVSVAGESLTVQPVEVDGDLAMQAADSSDNAENGTHVQLGAQCSVETAVIDTASGNVTMTPATAAEMKCQCEVAIFGETQHDGSILASRVVLLTYTGATGARGEGA